MLSNSSSTAKRGAQNISIRISSTADSKDRNISITVFISAIVGLIGFVIIVMVLAITIFLRSHKEPRNSSQGNITSNVPYTTKRHTPDSNLFRKLCYKLSF